MLVARLRAATAAQRGAAGCSGPALRGSLPSGARGFLAAAPRGCSEALRRPLGGAVAPGLLSSASSGGGQRSAVTLASVLQRAENVLPCYVIVQRQLGAKAHEVDRVHEDGGWAHTIAWTLGGRELRFEARGRTKREARNAAARELLQSVSASGEAVLDPGQNGAVAQWAIEWINGRLDASMELREEIPEVEEGAHTAGAASDGQTVHVATWSCPQLEGETTARAAAQSASESRRQAMAALFRGLPEGLSAVLAQLPAPSTAAPGEAGEAAAAASRAAAPGREARHGEMSRRHHLVVQKLGIRAEQSYTRLPAGEFRCTLRWSFWDAQRGLPTTVEVKAAGRSKAAAKALASEEMLIQQGHFPRLPESYHAATAELHRHLSEGRVLDAVSAAIGIMEDREVDVAVWSAFVPEVLRAALVETDGGLSTLLTCALRELRGDRGGAPIELWEALLDEASFALRHYGQASEALEQLKEMPLAESAFPSGGEREYYGRFRHLLALERHGGLLSGIHAYEMDSNAACSVPTVDVHHMEADMVVLTSTPESGIAELVDGARVLKASDIVLMVPLEVVPSAGASSGPAAALQGGGLTRSMNWQHPEAWLGAVTSVRGNPQLGEDVRIHTRRISRFGTDAENLGDGTAARLTPISLGRQYQLFFISMETPLQRQLGALRCLCRARFAPWTEGYEGRKPSYTYSESLRKVLLGGRDEARAGAEAPVPIPLGMVGIEQAMKAITAARPWLAALTASQRKALQAALEQRLSVIQGPPGTGKTYVACAIIAAWVDRYGAMGQRILAVADSNVAADNLHARLKVFGVESVRAGQGRERSEYLTGEDLRRAVMSAQVVVATCIGSGMEVLDGKDSAGHFHCVVIDECTQACEPAALVALGRMAEQAVLIGDQKQLPATVLSKLAQRDGLGTSLFERMVDSNGVVPTMLQDQRRMHSSIAEFPNQAFYGSRLINAISDDALAHVPGFPWPRENCRVCFVDVGGDGIEDKRGFSTFNTNEARCVARVLHDLLEAGVQANEVGVLTAYLAQRGELIRAVQDRGLGHVLPAVTVDTVDGYQGMERDVVLFSATRSNASNTLGFLADARRMNVMLTRARRGLIIFGNSATLRNSEAFDSHWPAWLDWVEERGAAVSYDALFGGSGPSALPGLAASAPAAMRAWEKVYSEQYGSHYFWNRATGQTQWEAPLGYVE